MSEENRSPVVIYEWANQAVDVRLDTDESTVWLTQRQMADLFGKDVRTVNEHLQNVFAEGELERESTIRDFRIVRQEGNHTHVGFLPAGHIHHQTIISRI